MKKLVFKLILSFLPIVAIVACNTKKEVVLNGGNEMELKNTFEKISGMLPEDYQILRATETNDYRQMSVSTKDGNVQLLYLLKHPTTFGKNSYVFGFWLPSDNDLQITHAAEGTLRIKPENGLKYVVGNDKDITVFDLVKEMKKVLRNDKNLNPENFKITALEWHAYKFNPVLDVQIKGNDIETNFMIGYDLAKKKAISVSCHGASCCKVRFYPKDGYYECSCEGCVMEVN